MTGEEYYDTCHPTNLVLVQPLLQDLCQLAGTVTLPAKTPSHTVQNGRYSPSVPDGGKLPQSAAQRGQLLSHFGQVGGLTRTTRN